MERDLWYHFSQPAPSNFNSHAHVERDADILSECLNSGDFNSHAHVERDADILSECLNSGDFNSHAHVERDCGNFKNQCYNCISTHTLTWSVTEQLHKLVRMEQFQLTRSRGA